VKVTSETHEYAVVSDMKTYRAYLERLQHLVAQPQGLDDQESKEAELLSLLLEDYEQKNYEIKEAGPVETIKFRMSELGLKQVDLVPYLGTKSRVSEILNEKRPLTVPMIRALSQGLGIPTDVLVGNDENETNTAKAEASSFPVKEMISRGWLSTTSRNKAELTTLIENYISNLTSQLGQPAFKRSLQGDGYSSANKYAIYAWLARVAHRAINESKGLPPFDTTSSAKRSLVQDAGKLSVFDDGPELAVDFIRRSGIAVIFEPALKKTQLDGAAFLLGSGQPVMALTLRQDRIDNFWFTLLHELAHVCVHLDKTKIFVDNLDSRTDKKIESEANRIARDALIKRADWASIRRLIKPDGSNVDELARKYRINAAVLAGRYQREINDFSILSDFLGRNEVRRRFLPMNTGKKP